MSADLGLDQLTDDQLVEFYRAMAKEVWRRGSAVDDAVRTATEGVRAAKADAQAAHTARADRAWATQWDDWACAKRIAIMMEETLGAGWRFTAWRSPRGERRVYLDAPDEGGRRVRSSDAIRAAHGKPPRRPPSVPGKVSYQVDGGTRFPPGHLQIEGSATSARRSQVEAIVRFIAARWDERGTTPGGLATNDSIVAAPAPPYYH